MDHSWHVEGLHPDTQWSLVPSTDLVDAQEWVDEECARVREWWDGAWEPRVERDVRAVLAQSVAPVETGTLCTWVHWPLPVPVTSRVRIMLASGPPVGAEAWEEAGFDVDEYPGAGFGPGLKCLASRDEHIGGETLHLSTAVYAFAARDGGVLVVVESGARKAFELTLAQLPIILSTLKIVRPDGHEFISEPVADVTRHTADEWGGLSHA